MGSVVRKTAARVVLAILSTALSCLFLDLAGRSIYDRWILVRPTPILKNRWPVDARLDRYDASVGSAVIP